MADTPSAAEHRARPAAGDRRGPPPCSARRAAARRTDLGDGGRRRRHAGDHADRRTAGSAGAPATTTAPAQPPSADRVRDYQDRLRMLEAQAMRDAQATAPTPSVQPVQYDDTQPPPPQDPIAADRKRREYESLFASNVVLSRRPENERPDVRSEHDAIECAAHAQMRREPVRRRRRRRRRPRHAREPLASRRTRPPRFRSSRQRALPASAPSSGAAAHAGPDARDQRRRAAASRARGHGHRHRADESAGWHRAPRR